MRVQDASGSGRNRSSPRSTPSLRDTLIAVMRTLTLAVSILLLSTSVGWANDPPASTTRLLLPEDRDTHVSLPDVAFPVVGEERGTEGFVSLAGLRGQRYILHVFASW